MAAKGEPDPNNIPLEKDRAPANDTEIAEQLIGKSKAKESEDIRLQQLTL